MGHKPKITLLTDKPKITYGTLLTYCHLLECLQNVFKFRYQTLDDCVVQVIEKDKKVKL